jgi:aryl-alcohol dehydrogenase-like predicted oxidoreductase
MRRLGREGPDVSVVGLGCNNFGRRVGRDGTREVVDAALEAGVTLFDTADVYGDGNSERYVGEALGERRDRVVVATKFGHRTPGGPDVATGSREWMRFAVEASLARLGTDWIDVYQYHRPDGVTPMAETIRGLAELVRDGVVRYLGISNVRPDQVEEAAATAQEEYVPLVSVQNQYSLLEREPEDELLPTCERLGLGVLPYFPLAHGLLTGKYRRGEPPPAGTRLAARPERLSGEVFERVEALERYAQERSVSLLELAVGGLAAQPAVASVIAGATKPDQVRANARAGDWEPDAADLEALAKLR